jgi:hypothetical protein
VTRTELEAATRPQRWRKPLIVTLAIILALVLGGVVAWWLGHRDTSTTKEAEVRTAEVVRTSLEAGFKLSGTIGYGEAKELAGANGALVTKLPEAGQMIAAGQVIMEVEGAPVFLLQGELPLWREIQPGVTGLDVQSLRDSLAAIGISAGSGQTYDATLSAAIATLYTNNGYSAPVALEEDKAAQEKALEALDTAKDNLTAAQETLTRAQDALTKLQNQKPSESDRLAAQGAVDQAREAYNNQTCVTDEGLARPCTDDEKAVLKNNLDVAVARYNELVNPTIDTTDAQASVDQAQKGVTQAQKAVTDAQEAYDETLQNAVGPKNILIVPEAKIRVNEVKATVGEAISGPVLTWTKTVLYGQGDLTDAQQRMLTTGTQARLLWSDGTELTGNVAEITDASYDYMTGARTAARVRIDVADQAALAERGPSAVTISFIQEEAENTLVIPVTALVVPAEGGYAVEMADGHYVRVEIGLIADAKVQVFSDELHEGDKVVVP